MRFPFFRNRDSVKNGILISIRRTGDGFHPGLFSWTITATKKYYRNILLDIEHSYKLTSKYYTILQVLFLKNVFKNSTSFEE